MLKSPFLHYEIMQHTRGFNYLVCSPRLYLQPAVIHLKFRCEYAECIFGNAPGSRKPIVENAFRIVKVCTRIRSHKLRFRGNASSPTITCGSLSSARQLGNDLFGGKSRQSLSRALPRLLLEKSPPSLFDPYPPTSTTVKQYS